MADPRDVAGVLAPPPVLYGAGLAVGGLLEALLPSADVPDLVRWTAGPLLLAAGGALAVAFLTAFRRAGTPVDVHKPTTGLVTSGPYRLTRNPGYVALTLLFLGICALAGALWPLVPLVAVVALVDRTVIAREERYLSARFGEPYDRYRTRVRRWV